MKCTNCGTEIANDRTFCPECGTGVTVAQTATATAQAGVNTEPVYEAPVAPAAPVYQEAYTHTAPAYREITEEQLPDKFKPMGAWGYFGHSLLFSIPLVGFILLIVFAAGGTKNINKRNYARSYFCGLLIVAIIAIIAVVLFLIFSLAATGSTSVSIDSFAQSMY